MRILDFFKKKNHSLSPAEEDLALATEEFEQGHFQRALRALSWGFRKDVGYKPLYELAIKCLDALEATEEAELFKNAVRNPTWFNSYNDLGNHFFESGHYDLALPFLKKAALMNPSRTDTVHDLAITLARQFQIEQALDTLEDHNHESRFWDYWYWCKLRILAGKLQGVKNGINRLNSFLDNHDNQEEIEFPRQKLLEVSESLLRYELMGEPKKHIQHWHFIQYGAVILDYYDDPEHYVAGGRYVALWHSYESINDICLKLQALLKALKIPVGQVRYLSDRDSTIIGATIGMVLDVEATPYQKDMNTTSCIIVAANSIDYDAHEELSRAKNGEILFALNHHWLLPSCITPDICGMMTQSSHFSWNGGGYEISENKQGKVERTEPDERTEHEIARDIFNVSDRIDPDWDYLDFYREKKDYLKSIGSIVSTQRFNFTVESPLAGSHF